jgi:hypothetical protein
MSPKRASSALMPASLPLVISPLRSVLECDGVEVVLVSVEVWRDEVVVRAHGLPGEGTVALEHEFSDALERWNRQGADGHAVPRQPAERTFDLDVSIADGVGHGLLAYELRARGQRHDVPGRVELCSWAA